MIGRAGLSEMEFSLAFATVAIAMIVTTRFAKFFVARWGVQGSLVRAWPCCWWARFCSPQVKSGRSCHS